MTTKTLSLIIIALTSCSCSSLQHVVTADNVLRAVEIGENASRIYRDGLAIYEAIREPAVVPPTK